VRYTKLKEECHNDLVAKTAK